MPAGAGPLGGTLTGMDQRQSPRCLWINASHQATPTTISDHQLADLRPPTPTPRLPTQQAQLAGLPSRTPSCSWTCRSAVGRSLSTVNQVTVNLNGCSIGSNRGSAVLQCNAS